MKKAIYWMAMNFGFAALVYLGFVVGVEGAQYVVKFFVWAFCLPLGLVSLTDDMQKKLAAESPHPVRRSISRGIGWAALAVFVWYGHVVTGAAWALWMLCGAVARHGAKLHRDKAAASTA